MLTFDFGDNQMGQQNSTPKESEGNNKKEESEAGEEKDHNLI